MKLDDVREAIATIRYKPFATIELAPVQGRLFNPEAGALRIIIRLNLVPAEDPQSVVMRTHIREIPPADSIRDRSHLLSLIRNAIHGVENYENDQWLSLGGLYPFRKVSAKALDNPN